MSKLLPFSVENIAIDTKDFYFFFFMRGNNSIKSFQISKPMQQILL